MRMTLRARPGWTARKQGLSALSTPPRGYVTMHMLLNPCQER